MVGNGDVIFLLAVVGTVCVLVIYYYVICISSSRINKTISTVQRVRARQHLQQQRQSSSGTSSSNQDQDQVRRTLTRSIQSDRLPRADENTYILGPTATAAESQRDFRSGRPHRVGGRGGGQRLSVPGHVRMANDNTTLMRFYTAEELVNFPFDEHIEALRRQIDEEEMRRSNRASMDSIFMRPIDYSSSRRVTVASPLSMDHGQTGHTDEDNIMMSPDHSYGPVILRPEIVIDEEDRISIDRIHTRQSRARMCYSIPANYIGRPPAYLATHEDPPPNYSDAVKLAQIKEEEPNEVTS